MHIAKKQRQAERDEHLKCVCDNVIDSKRVYKLKSTLKFNRKLFNVKPIAKILFWTRNSVAISFNSYSFKQNNSYISSNMSMIRCCFEPVELPEFIDTMIQKCTDPGCKWLRNEKKIDIKAIKFLFCRLSFIIISYVITETPTPNSIGSIIYGEFNSMLFFVGFVIPMHCCLYLVFFLSFFYQ